MHDIPPPWPSLESFQHDRPLRLENTRSGHILTALVEVPEPAVPRLVHRLPRRSAFAVLVEGGGLGADCAGPIANAFLRNL